MEAKENLLAFDDTTFYSKLVSGEASLVQAWDGWCEYGRAEDPKNIDFVIPDEGSDLWTDTMVVMESSENKAAAYAFIDYILRPEVGKSIVEYTLYKMPNAEVMAAVDPAVHQGLSRRSRSRRPSSSSRRRRPTSARRARSCGPRRPPRSRREALAPTAMSTGGGPGPRRARGRVWGPRLVLLGPGAAWWLVFFLVPVGVLIAYSFFSRGPYGGVIYEPTLKNYVRAFDPLYIGVLWTSVRIASIATLAALLLAYPAALVHRPGIVAVARAAARARDPAVLDELPDQDVRVDGAAEPGRPDQQGVDRASA